MTPYKNLGRDSNIESYDISEDSIHVRFKGGRVRNYLFDSSNPGQIIVDKMKVLALQGQGLNEFISRTVKSKFSRKW
jgi:hypothetical protein